MIDRYKKRGKHAKILPIIDPIFQPYNYSKRKSLIINNLGQKHVPRVFVDISKEDILLYEDLQEVGYKYSNELDKWIISEQAVDYIYIGDKKLDLSLPGSLIAIQNLKSWEKSKQPLRLFTLKEYGGK